MPILQPNQVSAAFALNQLSVFDKLLEVISFH